MRRSKLISELEEMISQNNQQNRRLFRTVEQLGGRSYKSRMVPPYVVAARENGRKGGKTTAATIKMR